MLIGGIHTFLLISNYNISIFYAFVDATINYVWFSLLGVIVWYAVKYAKLSKPGFLNEIINQITIAAIFLLLWFLVSYFLLQLFYSSNKVYINYLKESANVRFYSGVLLYVILLLTFYAVETYFNLEEKLISENKLSQMVKQAEFDMLKSQINPHFLFNSLNSISALTLSNPEKAQEMIIKLSDYLRYTIAQNTQTIIPITKEIQNIKYYLDIESIRFGKKLNYFINISPAAEKTHVPYMILQPLYENAIKHGVYISTIPIEIITNITYEQELLKIQITNNIEHDAPKSKGNGIGLKNIRDRLKILYHSEELINIEQTNTVFSVTLFIPQQKT